MSHEIFEDTDITLKAQLKGPPKEGRVVFSYRHLGQETRRAKNVTKEEAVDLVRDDPFKAPLVPGDMASYVIEGEVFADGVRINNKKWTVWPRTATVASVDKEGAFLPYFRFRCKQGNRISEPLVTDRKGMSASFNLEKGEGFEIVPEAPFLVSREIVPVGRSRKVEVNPNFKVRILSPPLREKQYVNLESKTDPVGDDGHGSEVFVVVAVEVGAQDSPEQTKAYFKVTFTHHPNAADRSPRNDPMPRMNLTDPMPMDDGTGKQRVVRGYRLIEGKQRVSLQLGKAGGDRCVVEVGSTPECADDRIQFDNWRKVYYGLVGFKALDDLPSDARKAMKKAGDPIFVDYQCSGFAKLTEGELGSAVVPGDFVEAGLFGPKQVHIVTEDIPSTKLEPAHPCEAIFVVSDYVLSSGPGEPMKLSLGKPTKEKKASLSLGQDTYWSPDDTRLCITWRAAEQQASGVVLCQDKSHKHPDSASLGAIDLDKSTWRKIAIRLPNDAIQLKCAIDVDFHFRAKHKNAGFSFSFRAGNAICTKHESEAGVGVTVLHEIAHKMGMTPVGTGDDEFAPGLKAPQSVDQALQDMKFRSSGQLGHYFAANEFNGHHCAWGLTDKFKKTHKYRKIGQEIPNCIMFGASNLAPDQVFCPQCIHYLRARDLSKIDKY